MAGHARLSPWLWLGVLLAHGVALEWVGDHLAPMTALRKMADPMFTRVLQPEAVPAPVVLQAAAPAQPKRRVARQVIPHPAAAASVPAAPAVTEAPTPAPAPAPETQVAQAGPGPAAPASTPAAPSAPPASAASEVQPTNLSAWPVDTRLSYRLGGQFRSGELHGDARVQWQRAGPDYQVRVDIDITPWVSLAMTSQGEVTPQGLLPRGYEELRRGKRRAVQLGETIIALEGGRSAARPAGVQDTASQFVELAHRFASGQEKLEVGRSVTFWMARPGAVDLWTYDIVEREMLQTPNLGTIEAFRLKPRPIANPRGNITAEMWFAPSLQYLPVRIRVSMGSEAHVDLLVDKIEQR